MAHAAVVTELKGDNSHLQKSLDQSTSSVEAFGKDFGDVFAGMTVASAGFGVAFAGVQLGIDAASAAISGLADMFGDWASGYMEAEQAEASLAAAIKATGGAAGYTLDQMKQLADQLADVSTFEDDVVMGAQAVLATFKNVRGDQFKEATEAAADMASMLGKDLSSAAMQVGKALNDPIRGMSALAESGVSFSESQRAAIKSLVELGDVAGAQKIILEELRGEFGGQAQAQAETFGGQIEKLKNEFGDAGEEIFKSFLPAFKAIQPLAEDLIDAMKDIAPHISEGVERFVEMAESIMRDLKPAFEWIGEQGLESFTRLQFGLETVGKVAEKIFEAFGTTLEDFTTGAWEDFQRIYEGLADFVTDGLIASQTAVENWGDVCDATVTATALSIVKSLEDVKHIFATDLPDTLTWFARNWDKMLLGVLENTHGFTANIVKNLKDLTTNLPEILAGTKEFKWDAINNSFEEAFQDFPGLASRAMTDVEKVLSEDLERIRSRLKNSFADNRREFDEMLDRNRERFNRPEEEEEREDPKHNASDEYERPPIKEKVEREVKTKEDKQIKTREDKHTKEKVDRTVDETRVGGGSDDLESLHKRISESAASVPIAEHRERQPQQQQQDEEQAPAPEIQAAPQPQKPPGLQDIVKNEPAQKVEPAAEPPAVDQQPAAELPEPEPGLIEDEDRETGHERMARQRREAVQDERSRRQQAFKDEMHRRRLARAQDMARRRGEPDDLPDEFIREPEGQKAPPQPVMEPVEQANVDQPQPTVEDVRKTLQRNQEDTEEPEPPTVEDVRAKLQRNQEGTGEPEQPEPAVEPQRHEQPHVEAPAPEPAAAEVPDVRVEVQPAEVMVEPPPLESEAPDDAPDPMARFWDRMNEQIGQQSQDFADMIAGMGIEAPQPTIEMPQFTMPTINIEPPEFAQPEARDSSMEHAMLERIEAVNHQQYMALERIASLMDGFRDIGSYLDGIRRQLEHGVVGRFA